MIHGQLLLPVADLLVSKIRSYGGGLPFCRAGSRVPLLASPFLTNTHPHGRVVTNG